MSTIAPRSTARGRNMPARRAEAEAPKRAAETTRDAFVSGQRSPANAGMQPPAAPGAGGEMAGTAPSSTVAPRRGITAPASSAGVNHILANPTDRSAWLEQPKRGPEIVELQNMLKAKGFDPGPADGYLGPQTERAIRAFQAATGCVVDGKVGPQTAGALQSAPDASHAPPAAPSSGAPSAGDAPTSAPAAPGTPSVGDAAPPQASTGIQAAIDFGRTQLGAPYTGGASPFRFGKPGDGGTYQMDGQRAYVSPKGVVGYDCSGFMVTMLKKANIDISHLGSSRAMKSNLPEVPKDQLQPGDLLVKNGHVSMYIGNGQMIESVPSGVRVADASTYINNPDYTGHRPG